jgi:hypothetical protein
MIPWFFKLDGVSDFSNIRPARRKRIIREQISQVEGQKILLKDISRKAKTGSRKISRHIDQKEFEDAKDKMTDVALVLKTAEPVLNNYVHSLLMLKLYEIMDLDGYNDPEELSSLMDEIDFGLYSSTAEATLNELLRSQADPLAALGINLDDD